MANSPRVSVVVDHGLVREVAERCQLGPYASVSEIIRYALAVAAGRPDPHQAALMHIGRPLRERSGAAV